MGADEGAGRRAAAGHNSRCEFGESARLMRENAAILAGGVSSNFRLGMAPTPLVFERGDGPYLHDADGNLTTGSFVDYLVPSAADLPHFDTGRTETPATSNPLGVKGVGEAGTIASTPAVTAGSGVIRNRGE